MRREATVAVARVLAGLALAACVLAACAGSSSPRATSTSSAAAGDDGPGPVATDSSPTPAATPTEPTPAPLAWSGCGSGLQCATLRVPLDYAHPQGPKVSLAVIRRPASQPGPPVGALVVNPGGPGGSGVAMVRSGFGVVNGFAQHLDIVSWDPRGVGQSQALTCGSGLLAFQHLNPDPPTAAGLGALDRSAQSVAVDCAQHGGELLDHLDSNTTARDLEQLRLALGQPKLTYAGFSYGTALGLAYARLFPTHLRALLLDGVVDPDWDLAQLLSVQTSALDQSLQRIFDACIAAPTCPEPDPAASYDQLATRLAAQPLAVGDQRLGPSELATAAIESTYDPDSSGSEFLEALAAADAGNGSPMLSLAAQYRQAVPDFQTYVATMCVDVPHPVGAVAWQAMAQTLEARSPRLGGAVANELLPCAFWSAPVARTPSVVRAVGAPPILVVGNTGDAATPIGSAQAVAAQLADGVLLTYDGEGHTSVDRSSCVDNTERRYLTDLTIPPAGALCAGGT